MLRIFIEWLGIAGMVAIIVFAFVFALIAMERVISSFVTFLRWLQICFMVRNWQKQKQELSKERREYFKSRTDDNLKYLQ
jgi:hypothetical protein